MQQAYLSSWPRLGSFLFFFACCYFERLYGYCACRSWLAMRSRAARATIAVCFQRKATQSISSLFFIAASGKQCVCASVKTQACTRQAVSDTGEAHISIRAHRSVMGGERERSGHRWHTIGREKRTPDSINRCLLLSHTDGEAVPGHWEPSISSVLFSTSRITSSMGACT